MKSYKLLQWGSKRSVVEYDGVIYLIDNYKTKIKIKG